MDDVRVALIGSGRMGAYHGASLARRIPGARLMPKQQLLADGLAKLERTRRTVVYCKGGTRSRDVVQAMCQAGFTDVSNLDGGILSWIRTVDPSLPQY